jgi:nucleotide-binding universal stress UspA family protein
MTYTTILVNLEAGRSNKQLLQVAGDVAERFAAGIIGSTACTPIQMLYGDCYAYGEVFDQDSKEIAKETVEVEAAFRAAMAGRAKVIGWRAAVLVTSLADHLATMARGADLIMTSSASDGPFNAARQISLGDLLMQAGRPVLVVAAAPTPFRMDSVVIAWKDSREARRAAADALPLLKAAKHVSVVEIAAKGDLEAARSRLGDVTGWLGRHGIAADLHARTSIGDDAADLHAFAEERGADIVVAGAYGHSRLREWALGGVTRSLLSRTALTSFVSH